MIGMASGAAYGPEDLRIHACDCRHAAAGVSDPRVKVIQPLGPRRYIVTLPRYEAFTATALALNAKGARFVDIAGNDELLITPCAARHARRTFRASSSRARRSSPIRTMQRLALRVRWRRFVRRRAARAAGATIEHLYDY